MMPAKRSQHPYGSKAYWAELKREARKRELARRNATASVCQFRMGQGAVCGGRLEDHVDRLGRLFTVCRMCIRREAGICRDCPRPVSGKRLFATRCAECGHRKKLECSRDWQRHNVTKEQNRARQAKTRQRARARKQERAA